MTLLPLINLEKLSQFILLKYTFKGLTIRSVKIYFRNLTTSINKISPPLKRRGAEWKNNHTWKKRQSLKELWDVHYEDVPLDLVV